MPRAETCPLCGKPATPEHKPFCSRGCRDRDLLKWLGEGYRVPAEPADPTTLAYARSGLDSRDDHD